MSFDPGETTGYSVFYDLKLVRADTFTLLTQGWALLHAVKPDIVICESFHLYNHKSQTQIGSDFFTVEVIGVIRLYCLLNGVHLAMQTAQLGKSIWDDSRLQQFGYLVDNRHARDAVRHNLQFQTAHRYYREQWNDTLRQDGRSNTRKRRGS